MAQVLLHINEVELVLSRLFDILNEGGHLLIVDFNKNEKVVSVLILKNKLIGGNYPANFVDC
jgi:2-polyprenyl-3-methyl-5-hydroxy-6-metoxy-1,4-benzoquinol methylase